MQLQESNFLRFLDRTTDQPNIQQTDMRLQRHATLPIMNGEVFIYANIQIWQLFSIHTVQFENFSHRGRILNEADRKFVKGKGGKISFVY